MKKSILMLVLSIYGSLFAQSGQPSQSWNQNIEMYYPNNTKVIVASTITPLILKADKINIDSLVKVALKKYNEVEEETDEINAKTVIYTLGINDKDWIYTKNNTKDGISISIHKPTKKMYGFLPNGETVSLKTQKDTLMINLIYGEVPLEVFPSNLHNRISKEAIKNGNQLSLGFIVNDLKQLENLDYGLIRQDIKNAILKIQDKAGFPALAKDLTMPISIIKNNGSMKMDWQYQKADQIELSSYFGAGWIRNKFIPSINPRINLDFGKYGFGIGADLLYDAKVKTDNSYKTDLYTFYNLSFRINEPNKTKNQFGYSGYTNSSTIAVGRVVGNSDFFPKNTWKFAYTNSLFKHITISPEFYFNFKTKDFYPSIRLLIN